MRPEVSSYDEGSGQWVPSAPLGYQGGIDIEVAGFGPFEWSAWDEDVCIAAGKARTRIGVAWSIRRAKRRVLREGGEWR